MGDEGYILKTMNTVYGMKNLKIHLFQHAAFEGLGSIEEWISTDRHSLTTTKFHENIWFPELNSIDWLIIMGGPMSVHDEEQYSWLRDEKQYMRHAIEAGKTVLGICLGSQLISEALGARVYKNREKEIGWFNVELSSSARKCKLVHDIADAFCVFHWHGDTFDLPEDAIHLFSSKATLNQGYIYKERVVALQFHLETTLKSLQQILDFCRNDLTKGRYVQTEEEILNNIEIYKANRITLFNLLDRLAEQA